MTDQPHVIDGDATELPAPASEPTAATDYTAPGTAVAIRDRTAEVLKPVDADELVASFTAYQQLLPRLLTDDDYQQAGRGKRFVKKSGWRKIARAFRLNVEIVRLHVERDEHGHPVRAEAVARAIAPNGDFQDGDGYCSVDEDRVSGSRGNRTKLENDLRATATTRAKNRAISDLVGMGEVSADEIALGGEPVEQGPPFGKAADQALADKALRAIQYLLHPVDAQFMQPQAENVWQKIMRDTRPYGQSEGGYMPWIAARALVWVAAELKGMTPAGEVAGEATEPLPLDGDAGR